MFIISIYNYQLVNINSIYVIIKIKCDDNERQNMFARISRVASLPFLLRVKYVWGREYYIKYCNKYGGRGVGG